MNIPPIERDETSAPFFEAAARQVLMLRYAADGKWFSPETEIDPVEPGRALEWRPSAGRGILVSWTVMWGRVDNTGQLPPLISIGGLVELDEGPWILGRIVDVDPSILSAGAPLRVVFPPARSGDVVPAFTLA
jgi:uncharacterized OB-fold protein